MFTGRWPHEVGEKWRTPLQGDFATLAEYLGSHGYATAGFVGNVGYCSQETGLARGFTHYEDHVMENLAPLRTAALVEYLASATSGILRTFDFSSLEPLRGFVTRWFEVKRKNAALIRRAFLRWVSQREETSRPFFAFLNFFDAHQQYVLPAGTRRRFVNYSLTTEENRIMYDLWPILDKMRLPRPYIDVARDSYDDCLSYIDEQLGLLFDALQRHGVLNRTLVIVTSDHGEGLGDHDLFDHGLSLYRTEIRVPLVIRPPSALNPSSVVEETVSLRDLPATIVDLVGLGAGSPFPGGSLARFWRNSPSKGVDRLRETEPVVSELKEPNSSTGGDKERSPGLHGPLISLAADNFVYIRNEGDGTEQLFDMRADPQELNDKSRDDSTRPVLEDFRQRSRTVPTKIHAVPAVTHAVVQEVSGYLQASSLSRYRCTTFSPRDRVPALSGRREPFGYRLELVENHALGLGERARHPFVAGGQRRVGVAQLELDQGEPEPGLAETMVESRGPRGTSSRRLRCRSMPARPVRSAPVARRATGEPGLVPSISGLRPARRVEMRDRDPVGQFPGESDPACLGLAGRARRRPTPGRDAAGPRTAGHLGGAGPRRERHTLRRTTVEEVLPPGGAAHGVDCFDSSSAQSRASIIPREL